MLVLQEVFGIDVKEYNGSKASGDELLAIVQGEIDSDRWGNPFVPKAGDVAVMYSRATGKPGHMGVFVGDGHILHSPEHDGDNAGLKTSAIHPVRLLKNIFLRIEFYRYDNSC